MHRCNWSWLVMAVVAPIALAGCAAASGAEDSGLKVHATTGYLADVVANVAPDAEVATLVGPGGDPHTYQPSTRDIQRLVEADVVVWNGLRLEAQMEEVLLSLGDRQLAVGDALPTELLLELPATGHDGSPLHDPHVWNSPAAWSLVVELVAEKLSQVDPGNAGRYASNADAYVEEIQAAHERASSLFGALPAERRILVTGHDAFAYFGETYGLDVHATDFISTDAQLSAVELSRLADLIAENEVPVIFQDNQANPQAITSLREAVASRGWQVKVSGAELYADSLGSEPGVGTHLEVFAHNTQVVAAALAPGEGER